MVVNALESLLERTVGGLGYGLVDFEYPLQLLAHGCAVSKGDPRPVRPRFMYLLNKHS